MSLTRRQVGPPAQQPPIPRGVLRKQLKERMIREAPARKPSQENLRKPT